MPSTVPAKRRLSFDDEGDNSEASDEESADLMRKVQKRGIPQRSLLDATAIAKERKEEERREILQSMLLPARQQKGKDFAWMDSEEEDEGAAARSTAGDGTIASLSPSGEELDALPTDLKEIQTFGQLMRVSASLQATKLDLPFADILSICEVSARVKFFASDLFDKLLPCIVDQVRQQACTPEQLLRLATALVELNACQKEVMTTIATHLLPQVPQMTKQVRLRWLKLHSSMCRGDAGKSEDAFEVALRTAPLPGDDGETVEENSLCWDYERGGFCPRGKHCKWVHRRRDKDPTPDN